MIDVNADIISGHSIGNIEVGRNTIEYIDEIYCDYIVNSAVYDIIGGNGGQYQSYELNNGLMVINMTMDGEIRSLICNQTYQGLYKNKIHPSISMDKIFSFSTHRMILYDEALYLYYDFGMGLLLPSDFFMCDRVDDIAPDVIFNKICVHQAYNFK